MSTRNVCIALSAALVLAACNDESKVTAPQLQEAQPVSVQGSSSGVNGTATGGGHFLVSGVLGVQFSMSAVQVSPDGSATGQAHHSVVFGGELVEFYTDVTCVTFDEENGRAWIGGTIKQNNSTHPLWTTDLNEVGDAIWWRVVDNGEGAAATPDRSTFVGFEGNGGLITSEEYCDAQIWPADDARTSPVTQGNVQVRP